MCMGVSAIPHSQIRKSLLGSQSGHDNGTTHPNLLTQQRYAGALNEKSLKPLCAQCYPRLACSLYVSLFMQVH